MRIFDVMIWLFYSVLCCFVWFSYHHTFNIYSLFYIFFAFYPFDDICMSMNEDILIPYTVNIKHLYYIKEMKKG